MRRGVLRKIFDTGRTYARSALAHIADFAKKTLPPTTHLAIEKALDVGLTFMSDKDPHTTNPTFGWLAPPGGRAAARKMPSPEEFKSMREYSRTRWAGPVIEKIGALSPDEFHGVKPYKDEIYPTKAFPELPDMPKLMRGTKNKMLMDKSTTAGTRQQLMRSAIAMQQATAEANLRKLEEQQVDKFKTGAYVPFGGMGANSGAPRLRNYNESVMRAPRARGPIIEHEYKGARAERKKANAKKKRSDVPKLKPEIIV